ncbi:error-prone DNA polymerase [Corynebacterium aquilae]|uniref:Error-prone DNA polymerase n=1 Tax=Corynebacterium aquilae DSM 44791 TaxID=1431546 RepID=A0A1L7CE39_9CORY|nr:error-prone DNA polymerase [Corynebacterium aquilae]APT84111.1 DNA polymerase [Corynebacterium aquilae DSM 44791]
MDFEQRPLGINGRGVSWREINDLLSGKNIGPLVPIEHLGKGDKTTSSTHKRASGGADARGPRFAELHAYSSYCFMKGASSPEEFIEQASILGLEAIALIDIDGFYGAARTAEAAAEFGVNTVYGVELTLGSATLTLLCRGVEGYRALSHIITDAHMAGGEKGVTRYPPLDEIAARCHNTVFAVACEQWLGPVAADIKLSAEQDSAIARAGQHSGIAALVEAFGKDAVVVQLPARMLPEDADLHLQLRRQAHQWGLRMFLSGRPQAALKEHTHLAAAKNSLARRESLEQAHGQLHPMGATWLVDGATLAARHPDCIDAIATTVELAAQCAFELELVAPQLPPFNTPEGFDEYSWLEKLTLERMTARYASRTADIRAAAHTQVQHELRIIRQLAFPGYFLIVCDLVDFCRDNNILCQGRGSAANSAVCFSLGITNVEPISNGLLFERFLSPDRDGPPDIDIDIESGRREEVIQYAYRRYGRDNAAQVANVMTYRRKGAIRDAARALGYPQGACDAFSAGRAEPPHRVEELAEQFLNHPRHLGIHSGGMVICDRPIAEVVPCEWARKKDRSVVQWDKDDCAWAGLVKFDLLGLGMLEALHHTLDLIAQHRGDHINLWELDCADPKVYDMLSRADAVGVFQVESRAQMATLPRLKPRVFFDLVVEVALIRPGPIQGGSVHPYIRRRNGLEEVTYDHPCLEPALEKTLGIPLFQEQLMQIAKDAAGFSGAEADSLRRAMGSKRSPEKMARLKKRFYQGLESTQGITGDTADLLWTKMVAFAAYGFPESHSQSFASLVYFSAWLKYYYPAEFCAGLLRAQPMGFYSPQSLIADARRHAVTILPIDIATSDTSADSPNGAIRLGFDLVKGLGEKAAERIVAARAQAPFVSVADVARRADLNVAQLEALSRAGAFDSLNLSRRQALWESGVAATEKDTMLPGLRAIEAPSLPGMNAFELLATDISSTGVSPTQQPMELLRERLQDAGILAAADLPAVADGTRVRIAGIVTHRQRPQTAQGTIFFGVEDETGLMNVVVTPGLWEHYKVLARTAKALIIRGVVRNASGAVTITADKLEPLPVGQWLSTGSRDFR